MLKFNHGNACFNFRSVAVVIYDNRVLVHRAPEDEFWALPGGRVEFFEHSDMTLQRELFEELGAKAEVKRHLWYVENFFEYSNQKYHEVANYFLVEIENPQQFPMATIFSGIEPDVDLEFKWQSLERLSELNLKPAFLQQGLLNLPLEPQFVKVCDLDIK